MMVDSKGYILELENLDPRAQADKLAVAARDERITRLAVLKAAAEFVGRYAQMREDIKSEHVLVLADRWLEWVERD